MSNTIAYQEYWQQVRDIASEAIAEAIAHHGKDASEDQIREFAGQQVHETCDQHEWVIYTWANPYVLIHSENEDALFEYCGPQEFESYSDVETKMAAWALLEDCNQELARQLDERASGAEQ